MKVPKTLFRVIKSQINYEKYIYVLMKRKMYEYNRQDWSLASQAAFVAGMEYAYEVMENRAKYDGLQDQDAPPKSHNYKILSSIHYMMKTVDKYLDPLIKNGSISAVMKNY